MTISAITAVIIPSKGNSNRQAKAYEPGISFISSGGFESTVRQGEGYRTNTITGGPCLNLDGASATSFFNDDECTITFEMEFFTGDGTSYT